jgi:hypothetical protein
VYVKLGKNGGFLEEKRGTRNEEVLGERLLKNCEKANWEK